MHPEDSSDSRKLSKQYHLKHERELRGLTQSQVAEHIGTTQINVSRWENGNTLPSPYYRQQLSEFFGKSIQELGLLHENNAEHEKAMFTVQDTSTSSISHESTSSLPIWHVPYRRNPFFTGREDTLAHLQCCTQKYQNGQFNSSAGN